MSRAAVSELEGVIAAHLGEWDVPHVELAVYGSADPKAIARPLTTFCQEALGASPVRAFFHRSSIGTVTGLQLDDRRRVVVKGHQPDRSTAFLTEIVRLHGHLASAGLSAPEVITGPRPLGAPRALEVAGASRAEGRDLSGARRNAPANVARAWTTTT